MKRLLLTLLTLFILLPSVSYADLWGGMFGPGWGTLTNAKYCTYESSTNTVVCNSEGGTGSVATDTIWDTAGDLVYGTGNDTAQKLAIGTAYQLLMTNAGATAPAWTSTLGATGTRLTKGWFTDLEITNAPTINGAAWTTILQPLDAELTALAGLTFADKSIIQLTGPSAAAVLTCTAANQLIGVNAANDALECKSTINVTIDDSAAQFKHADSTAALKISVDGATADKTMTIQSTHTDNRTFTLPNKNLSLDGTFNDGKYCTYASSGTVISCNADGGGGTGDFKADGTVPMTAAIDLSTANAANSAGEFGYASNAFSWYANSEDFTATAGSNLWTFASGTSATFAFTPSVALNGGFSAVGSNTVSNGATSAGYIYFKEDSDNGTNTAQLIGPASTADVVITLPAETGTVALVKNEKLASFAWDNGASAVATTGSKRCVAIPYAATIVGYTMVISGDPGAGGTILNITKDAWSDSSLPTTEIDASAPPTVADNKVASTDSTLTGWTKSVAANDIICADVATNAVATWISLTIFGTK